jgi:phage FluMu protein Com
MGWLILIAIGLGCLVLADKLGKYRLKTLGSSPRIVNRPVVGRPAKARTVDVDSNIRVHPIVFQGFMKPLPAKLVAPQKGRGTSGESYVVSLGDLSCTCTNWEADRCRFPESDIRRICKHIARAVVKHDLLAPEFMWLLDGPLFPFPAKPYCAAVISAANGRFRAVRCERVEWVDVLADTGLKTRPFARFGFHADEKRWAYRDRAPNLKWIAPALCGWLESSASRRYAPCPAISKHSAEVRKIADEKSRNQERTEAENATRCFVCRHQMASLNPQPKTQVRCPRCKTLNYAANGGKTHNPARIALYAHYNGNYDDRKQVGIAVVMAKLHQDALENLKASFTAGSLSKDEYRAARQKLTGAHKKEVVAMTAEKDAALAVVRQNEEEMRRAWPQED